MQYREGNVMYIKKADIAVFTPSKDSLELCKPVVNRFHPATALVCDSSNELLQTIFYRRPKLVLIGLQPVNDRNMVWDLVEKIRRRSNVPIILVGWIGFLGPKEDRIWDKFFNQIKREWRGILFIVLRLKETPILAINKPIPQEQSPEEYFEGMNLDEPKESHGWHVSELN